MPFFAVCLCENRDKKPWERMFLRLFLIQKEGYDIMSIINVNNLTYYYDGCDEAVYENV